MLSKAERAIWCAAFGAACVEGHEQPIRSAWDAVEQAREAHTEAKRAWHESHAALPEHQQAMLDCLGDV